MFDFKIASRRIMVKLFIVKISSNASLNETLFRYERTTQENVSYTLGYILPKKQLVFLKLFLQIL